jgi:hypothetical protein
MIGISPVRRDGNARVEAWLALSAGVRMKRPAHAGGFVNGYLDADAERYDIAQARERVGQINVATFKAAS